MKNLLVFGAIAFVAWIVYKNSKKSPILLDQTKGLPHSQKSNYNLRNYVAKPESSGPVAR